jgi:zinc and cadmium transporter
MSTAFSIFLATALVSLVSLSGVFFLSLREALLARLSALLVAFASGALLGGAFFHLLPESLSPGDDEPLLALVAAVLFFFALEKYLCWRHCHDARCEVHTFTYLNLIGDGIHNFLDGLIIAGAFLASTELGVVTTAVVLFHEVPQELGEFGVLIYGGFTRARAILLNLLSGLTAVAGGAVGYFFSFHVQNLHSYLLPFAAGAFAYIALADLIPELHKQRSPRESIAQFGVMLLGAGLLWAVRVLHHG